MKIGRHKIGFSWLALGIVSDMPLKQVRRVLLQITGVRPRILIWTEAS